MAPPSASLCTVAKIYFSLSSQNELEAGEAIDLSEMSLA
jgi:hypothetical protein